MEQKTTASKIVVLGEGNLNSYIILLLSLPHITFTVTMIYSKSGQDIFDSAFLYGSIRWEATEYFGCKLPGEYSQSTRGPIDAFDYLGHSWLGTLPCIESSIL